MGRDWSDISRKAREKLRISALFLKIEQNSADNNKQKEDFHVVKAIISDFDLHNWPKITKKSENFPFN